MIADEDLSAGHGTTRNVKDALAAELARVVIIVGAGERTDEIAKTRRFARNCTLVERFI